MKIAFIGIGNMGAPMARNLLRRGHSVTAFDVSTSARSSLEPDGAKTASTVREAAIDAEMVFTMLPNGACVEQTYLGEGGLLDGLVQRPVLVDCSTVSPQTAALVATEGKRKGFSVADAPVSGGVMGAHAGTLTFMVGSDSSVFNEIRNVLLDMGKTAFHAGGNGAGQMAKICNNMLAAILMAGTAEVLALAERNGVSAAAITEIINASTGGNFMSQRWNPWPGVQADSPASNEFKGGFQVGLMIKDLGLAMNCAHSVSASVPLGSLAKNLMVMHAQADANNLTKDISSIQTLYAPEVSA
ncbi:3-hydroxyisobutyrate dehydrogenase [Paraburkholderia caribensis]|uniref:3-hydroxyisobutyrate dehydrogenase n=1 Tax=Paraburkholderia caribensis TaxID=75105 RepID=UPI0031D2022E